MQIKYVVSTMVFWWREHPLSFEQECQFLRSLGFGIELWPHLKGQEDCRYERRNWQRLVSATQDMTVSMRTRNDRPNIEQWDEQLQLAKKLNANLVADLTSLRMSQSPQRDGYEFAGQVMKRADKYGVQLALETGPLQVLKKAGERFDSLRYCLDTGYANLDPENNFREYVDELAPRVAHLHLTDNYGDMDDHEPPGLTGGIPRENWDYLLKALGKQDNEVIGSFEMCPGMPGVMIRQATEFVFDELKWPNRPQAKHPHPNLIYNPT